MAGRQPTVLMERGSMLGRLFGSRVGHRHNCSWEGKGGPKAGGRRPRYQEATTYTDVDPSHSKRQVHRPMLGKTPPCGANDTQTWRKRATRFMPKSRHLFIAAVKYVTESTSIR